MNTPKRTLIACSMMEDEINNALEQSNITIPVVWMDRGFHNTPEKLKTELQDQIDQLQDQDEILLAFGLCGNGTEGICSKNTKLILPRFDDCINLLLCTGQRTSRALTRADSLYLTRGWTLDQESILQQYDMIKEQYDEEMCDIIFETMYGHYHAITVIDTGCYDTAPVLNYAQKAADLLDFDVETRPGSNQILRQLIGGDWNEHFIVLQPGEKISAKYFDV